MAPWSTWRAWPRGVAAIAIIISGLGCSTSNVSPAASPVASSNAVPGGMVKTVTLAAADGSGVSGTATLTDIGDGQTQVVIKVEANFNRDMPGAITPGTCAAIDESTIYHINDTRDGTSTSVIPVSLAALTARPFIVHIHTAPDEPSLAACGEIT